MLSDCQKNLWKIHGGWPCQNKTLIKKFFVLRSIQFHSFIFVSPKETSGFKASFPQGTRLRLKVLSARKCRLNMKNYLIDQVNLTHKSKSENKLEN